MKPQNYLRDQTIALSLTVITFGVLVGFIWVEILLLNQVVSEKISLKIRLTDILVGLTIYLKTAIDFAIFIGRLMDKNPGLRGRVGIEIGTAVGNGIGTMAILLVWAFFKEVDWLLAIMIFLAALVLLRLAQDTLTHTENQQRHPRFEAFVNRLESFLNVVNKVTKPLLSKIVPSHSLHVETKKKFTALLAISFTVPFILGLDDFAGYVPLFDVVNVFGFAIGALLGHMILNISLYISPERTIKLVKNPVISVVGSIVFVLLAAWGMFEVFKLLFLHH